MDNTAKRSKKDIELEEEIYLKYVEEFGYPPKEPKHFMTFSRRKDINTAISYKNAKSVMNNPPKYIASSSSSKSKNDKNDKNESGVDRTSCDFDDNPFITKDKLKIDNKKKEDNNDKNESITKDKLKIDDKKKDKIIKKLKEEIDELKAKKSNKKEIDNDKKNKSKKKSIVTEDEIKLPIIRKRKRIEMEPNEDDRPCKKQRISSKVGVHISSEFSVNND